MEITLANQTYQVQYVDSLLPAYAAIRAEPTRPPWVIADCETNGLHIKKHRPFLAAALFADKVFVFPTTKETVEPLPHLANYAGMFFNHNTNYDMHMFANITEDDEFPFKFKRYGDTMGLCRLAFEAVSTRDGGDSLKLKVIGNKYIDPTSNRYEKAVKSWLKQKESADRKILIAMLKGLGWTMKRFEAAMNKGAEPIPEVVSDVFLNWRNAYPEPTYNDVPMEIMMPYVAVDVIITDLVIKKALPVVQYKKQTHIMNTEFDLMPAVYDMERQGIPVDREYLFAANDKMQDEIDRLTALSHELAGQEFSVGQHALIKDIYEERTGERPESTDKQYLNKQKNNGDNLAGIISKLRRLEKWKTTYIERILEVSEYDGRFYTSMNQFNPVSGRFSGDAQQFPKDHILTEEGERLEKAGEEVPESEIIYDPRRAFLMRGYYLDYSQVELRVQGHYTLPFGGDTNLCRAYMPFKCTHAVTGETYDYETVEGRSRWSEMRNGAPVGDKHWEDLLKEGWSVWNNPDTNEPWVPTDVHGSTTTKALDIIGDMQGHNFKWWRNIGKRFNFMRNYGGGDAMAAEVLEIPIEHAKAMNRGYTEAFPLVISYQKGVEGTMRKNGYATNMSGRRYYVSDHWRFYKVANYLIQGSCADELKKKMVQIWKFIRKNGLKLRMVLCVHDELQFSCPDPAEDWAIWKIKEMMEDCPTIKVPIVAEVEFTDTTWAAKKKVLAA